jgi:hypothetical protein
VNTVLDIVAVAIVVVGIACGLAVLTVLLRMSR